MNQLNNKLYPSSLYLSPQTTTDSWFDWDVLDFSYQVEKFKADIETEKLFGEQIPQVTFPDTLDELEVPADDSSFD